MIPRYQRWLFLCLLASIVTMAAFLLHERQSFRERVDARIDATPLPPPTHTVPTSITLDLANDTDGTITPVERWQALPEEQSVRAQALIDRLMAEYALPRSDHPMPEGGAVGDVFFVDLSAAGRSLQSGTSGQLAVINFKGSFFNQHRSGLQTEMLSVLSLLGTLHANLPAVSQVQFIVDGRVRDTVAGHVDLLRMYPAIDTTISADELRPAP